MNELYQIIFKYPEMNKTEFLQNLALQIELVIRYNQNIIKYLPKKTSK